jgi:hypothetical protein
MNQKPIRSSANRPINSGANNVGASFDEYGNPRGHAFDLGGGDEDRVRGEKILLYIVYQGDEENTNFRTASHLQQTVAERGLQMDVRLAPATGNSDLTETLLSTYSQLWYISSNRRTLSDQQVQMITRYVRAGNGLAIWADNEPYYVDANLLATSLIGTSFSGDKMADQILVPGPKLAPGYFIEHALTQGVNNLYEGITICTIKPMSGVTVLGQSHDGQLCLGCFEQDNQRIVLDTGFTKLFRDRFQKSAGIARYLCNIAFWLARGSRSVEYKLLTPGREDIATISTGQLSKDYKVSLTQPTAGTYILQWNNSATLGLMVRDPRGSVVYDQVSSNSPQRATLRMDLPGNWTCQIKGVRVPSPNFPYVLTLVLDR